MMGCSMIKKRKNVSSCEEQNFVFIAQNVIDVDRDTACQH